MAKCPLNRSLAFAAGVVLIATLIGIPCWAQDDDRVLAIIADHHGRYPLMELDDVYKLIHQASLGSEHAVSDTASARRWLSNEIRRLGEGPADPLLDPLTPDSGLVRVHLRPFLEAGGDPEALLDAFIRTANRYVGSSTELKRLWSVAVRMATDGSLGHSPLAMKKYIAAKESEGFPAVHHSDAYNIAYRPAYRVVARSFLPPELEQ